MAPGAFTAVSRSANWSLAVFAVLLCCLATLTSQSLSPSLPAAATASRVRQPAAVPIDQQVVVVFGADVLRPPFRGLPPVKGNLNASTQLQRRDCTGNGTNFCFGPTATGCPGCGSCCSQSNDRHCCVAGSTCCGSGCCSAGEVCYNGQCGPALITTTSTSVVLITATHTATELANVEIRVVDTSTTVIETTITTSNVDVATSVLYTTTTVSAGATGMKRAPEWPRGLTDPDNPALQGRTPIAKGDLTPRHYPILGDVPYVYERAGVKVARQAATTVIVVTITSTIDVTSTAKATATATTTSTALATSVRTVIAALNAQTTTTVTSTVTRVLRPPVTETKTALTTIAPTPAATTSSASSSVPPSIITGTSGTSNTMPTPTVIGVAVGVGIGAIFLLAVAYAIWRVRRRRHRTGAPGPEPWHQTPFDDNMEQVLPPSLPQFLSSPPAHHNEDFSTFTRAPRRKSGGIVMAPSGGKDGRTSTQTTATLLHVTNSNNTRDHQRGRSSTGTYSYGGSTVRNSGGPIEVQGSSPPERYEVDGNSGFR